MFQIFFTLDNVRKRQHSVVVSKITYANLIQLTKLMSVFGMMCFFCHLIVQLFLPLAIDFWYTNKYENVQTYISDFDPHKNFQSCNTIF